MIIINEIYAKYSLTKFIKE